MKGRRPKQLVKSRRPHTDLDLKSRLSLQDVSESGQKVNWTQFFRKSEEVWDVVCIRLLTPLDYGMQVPSIENLDDTKFVRSVFNWLDVRSKSEVMDSSTAAKMQNMLWLRLFQGIIKLVFLVVLFLSIITLLLAYNSLWAGTIPYDTNSLLLTILIVPMYTFVRTKLTSSPLGECEKLLIKKSLDEGLDECFKAAKITVSNADMITSTVKLKTALI